MKRVIKTEDVELCGKVLKLPPSKKGKGHYFEILQKLVSQMDAMLSHHCKLLIFRVDLHLHQKSGTSRQLSTFFRRLKRRLETRGVKRLGYVWCREQDQAEKQHYHVCFMVDGNIYRNPYHLIELIRDYWTDWQVGSIWQPKKSFYNLGRGDLIGYQEVFDRISYLAKVDTKGNKPKTSNDYGGSRIKPKR